MKSFVPTETAATADDGPELPPPAGSDAEPIAQSEATAPAGEQAADGAAPDEQERRDGNAEVNPRLHGAMLPRPEAIERHACLDHRSGSPALS